MYGTYIAALNPNFQPCIAQSVGSLADRNSIRQNVLPNIYLMDNAAHQVGVNPFSYITFSQTNANILYPICQS